MTDLQTLCSALLLTVVPVQGDVGVVLGVLLNPAGKPFSPVAGCLALWDAKSGHTLLGQVVASGNQEALPPILGAVR